MNKFRIVRLREGLVRILVLIMILSTILVCDQSMLTVARAQDDSCDINARSALLMDASNGRVLFEQNGSEKLAMASTTKIMTCMLAIEYQETHFDEVKNRPVVASKYAATMPKVHLGMIEGESFSFEDLLYSLMLESHNDTAVAIAEYIAVDVESFCNLMNQRAKELGCQNTCFLSPNGLDVQKDGMTHETTAYDLAKITSWAVKNEKFCKIIQTLEHSFCSINLGRSFFVRNHNQFLNQMEGAFGVKTGYTAKAGYCFVGALKRNDHVYIGVLLGCGWPPEKALRWREIKKMMEYGLNNYKDICILKNHKLPDVKVINGVEETVKVQIDPTETKKDLTLLMRQNESSECKIELREFVEAPIEKGQHLGTIRYYVGNTLYKEYELCAKKSVKVRTYYYCMRQIFMIYLLLM